MHRDLPEFLAVNNSNLIFCDTLRWKRKHSCLSLTRQLKFYEFAHKQMLHCVDLNETCLRTITSKLQSYQGPRRKCFNNLNMLLDATATNNTVSSMMNDSSRSNTGNNETSWGPSLLNTPSKDIEFGKYVCRNNQLYILLRCWDKLLIMKRFTNSRKQETNADAHKRITEHYELVTEYEQVLGFRLVNDKITHQALVEITHTDGVTLKTDFQDPDNCIKIGDKNMDSAAAITKSLHGSSEFKQLLQRVNGLRSEMHLHSAMTLQDFDRIRDNETFGNAVTRSPLIDEKQLLTRFGDIWLRITTEDQDTLVLGIPLVNNAGTNTSTIARNIKPLIQITSDKGSSTLSCMSCHHRFYQLHHHHSSSDNDISSSQYSDNQDENLRALAWYATNPNVEQQQLFPECKAVLLISLPLSQLVAYQTVDFFINYEVANNNNNSLITKLQMFLSSFNIKDLLDQRDQYTTNFSNKMTLQQDFLAVIMTQAASCSLRITYQDHKVDYEQFCQVLMMHFQFDLWNSCINDNISNNNHDHDDDIDDDDMKSLSNDATGITVYSNRQPTSIWHGTLVLCRKLNDDNGVTYKWSIYAKNNAKLGLFLSVLFQDLLKYKCNVSNVELMASNDWDPTAISIENLRTLKMEDVLRQELKVWHDCVLAAGKDDLKLQLYKIQLECDLIVASVIKRSSQVYVH